MERGGCGGRPGGERVARGWYCRRTGGGSRGGRGRRWAERARCAEVRFEGRMRNEGKTLGNAASETRTMRKERKGVGWLALVFEFKYQTVRESRRGASQVPRSPCSRKTPVTLTLSLREINEAKWVPRLRCRQRAAASLISFFPFLDFSLFHAVALS